MDLTLSHETTYRFDPDRRYVVQSLRMTPPDTSAQTVKSWHLSAEGAQFGASFADGAGDRVTTLTHPGPVSELTLKATGRIETTDTSGVLKSHLETIAPEVYLRTSGLTAPNREIQEMSEGIGLTGSAQRLDLAHALMAAVAERLTFETGATTARSTAADALAAEKGVCQDFTHLLIALARLRRLPARYVTGYLFVSDGEQTHEAGHAWAEIYIANLGWVGFDAPNGCCPDERYVRLGSGLDAFDAAPVRGMALGDGVETLDVQVSVAEASQQQQQG